MGTNVVINPWVQKGMIDTIAVLAPICQITDYQYVLVVGNSVPAKNAAELVALAKKDPEKLTYSSSGVGGNNHLAGALFAEAAGIKGEVAVMGMLTYLEVRNMDSIRTEVQAPFTTEDEKTLDELGI